MLIAAVRTTVCATSPANTATRRPGQERGPAACAYKARNTITLTAVWIQNDTRLTDSFISA